MLTFNLKREWFDKIKSGEKTHEYREVKDYWKNRLFVNGDYSLLKDKFITFKCGYPKKDDKNKVLKAKIKQISLVISGINTDLKIYNPVYDIEFELIKENKNANNTSKRNK